jgi:hypothetical protein
MGISQLKRRPWPVFYHFLYRQWSGNLSASKASMDLQSIGINQASLVRQPHYFNGVHGPAIHEHFTGVPGPAIHRHFKASMVLQALNFKGVHGLATSLLHRYLTGVPGPAIHRHFTGILCPTIHLQFTGVLCPATTLFQWRPWSGNYTTSKASMVLQSIGL